VVAAISKLMSTLSDAAIGKVLAEAQMLVEPK
jgi:hypothetical protein